MIARRAAPPPAYYEGDDSMAEKMSLYDLTGKESGFLVYLNDKTTTADVIATNWLGFDADRVPLVDPLGVILIKWPMSDGYLSKAVYQKTATVMDVFADLPAANIVYDEHKAFLDPAIYEETADVWALPDGTLIVCPVTWD